MTVTKSSIYQFIVFHVYMLVYYLTFPVKDSWGPTFALIVLVLILMALEYGRSHILASPVILWYGLWLGVIAIARMDLNLYPFYKTWTDSLLWLVLINTEIFFVVYWLGEFSVKKECAFAFSEGNSYLADAVIIMLAVACVSFIINCIKFGVIPQLSGNANEYRESFIKGLFYKPVNLFRFVFVLVPMAYKKTDSKLKKMLIAFLGFCFIAEEMLSGWRSFTLQAMLLLLTGFFLSGERKTASRKKIADYAVLIIAVIVFLVFVGYIAATRDFVRGSLKDKINYLVYILDMYVAPNFLNMQSAMENVEPLMKPVYATEAFWGFFANHDAVYKAFGEIDQSIGAFNVSTYMLQPWADLGSAGTYICTAVIAFISGLSFKKCRLSQGNSSAFYLTLLGTANITIFVMHNNLFVRAKSIMIWLILALAVDILCRVLPEGILGRRSRKQL